MRPLIGITTRAIDTNRRYAVSADYVTSVTCAGGDAVLLSPEGLESTTLLQRLEGLILSGGGDISPDLYGGKNHQEIYGINSVRDRTEISAVKYAIEHQLPVLGICRGIQIMNVALGGTLIEHIPDLADKTVVHRLPEECECLHSVRLIPDSLTGRIFGQAEINVHSFHHQAVRDLAAPLKAAAHSSDGIIEAIELPNHPFFIGVQWHPELSSDPILQKLFVAFIEAATRKT